MKIIYLLFLTTLYLQADLGSLLNNIINTTQKSDILSSGSTTAPYISYNDKIQALKDILLQGTNYAIKSLSEKDGFLKNPNVKIPLPPSIKKTADIVSRYGGKKYVDDFDTAINYAAEKAVPKAYGIFCDTIKKMSIKDVQKLLKGGKHSATDFFREKDSKILYKQFYPIIKKYIDKTDVIKYYEALKNYYSKYIPSSSNSSNSLLSSITNIAKSSFANKYGINLDKKELNDYVTKKSIDGLFYIMGKKEEEIRANPIKATSTIAQKVLSIYK